MYLIYKITNIVKREKLFSFIKCNLRGIYLNIFYKELYLFEEAVGKNDFANAVKLGKEILLKGRVDNNFFKKYAKSYFYLGNKDRANEIMLKVLISKAKCNLETIIGYSKGLNTGYAVIHSEYEYLGGSKNYGCVKNYLKYTDGFDKCLVSKLVNVSSDHLNYEKYFYTDVCEIYPKLKLIAPEFYENQNIRRSNIDLITTEYILGGMPKKSDINEIIKINRIVESISSDEVRNFFDGIKIRNYYYIPRLIHKRKINREMISEMKFLLDKIKNGEGLKGIVSELDRIILGKQLYYKLKPKIHYSFCHNDFYKHNMVVEKSSGRCFAVDWNNYGIAIRGWDMNCYFSDFEFTFDEIQRMYIDGIELDNSMDEKIAKIYFVFMQIFIWMKKLKGRDCRDKLELYFVPAIRYMEETLKTL